MPPKFDPNKPFTEVDLDRAKEKPPKFNEKERYEELDADISSPSAFGETLTQAGAVLDIPGAGVRNLLSEEGKSIPEYAQGLRERGSREVFEAPTGKELLQEYEVLEEGDDSISGEILGAGVEMVADPSAIVGLGTKAGRAAGKGASKAIRSMLKKPLREQTAKALSRIQSVSESKAGKGLSSEEIATSLVEEDLSKLIGNPSKMLDEIGGISGFEVTKGAGGSKINKVNKTKGIVGELSDDLGSVVAKVSPEKPNIKGAEFNDKYIFSELGERVRNVEGTDASGFTRKDMSKVADWVQKIVNPKRDYSLSQLYRLRKSNGAKLDSREFYAPESKKKQIEKEARLAIQRKIDDYIKDELDTAQVEMGGEVYNARDYYETSNNRMSKLLKAKELIKMAKEKGLRDSSIVENLVGLGMRGAMGTTLGVGLETAGVENATALGGLMGLIYESGTRASDYARKNFPAFNVRAMEMGAKAPEMGIPLAPQMQRSFTDAQEQRIINEEIGNSRSPDSIKYRNLPLQLQKTKLPRTTEAIINNKEVLLGKVAQQAPQYFEQVRFVVEERPEDIEQMLPMVMQLVPQAFESDKYNRVDGKILDPMMQEKARKDLMQDARLSNTQRIQLIDQLNRNNTLEGY